ncbi:hypothetical protein [Vibrio owensii]|uniref:Uncharacterized protein n=1 Tax=Vibrio owensii CAIM 1854 = LMG 25443 TaxID=1229493 RepID=A0A0C1VW54_9VIBR|nr:hypothetical protein [Vibrio owensii]KIF54303.1 hypothetical protein H735_04455 [Vibrio owensii CAIM 1854 = LMG 25443]
MDNISFSFDIGFLDEVASIEVDTAQNSPGLKIVHPETGAVIFSIREGDSENEYGTEIEFEIPFVSKHTLKITGEVQGD